MSTKLGDFFGGNYITADKTKENPELLKELTVIGVTAETLKGDGNEQKAPKAMLEFAEVEETLLLNKTNYLFLKDSAIIAKVLPSGEDLTDIHLINAKIQLVIRKEMYKGELKPAVRIAKVTFKTT